jgi:sec-independent protein translocase protein TatA
MFGSLGLPEILVIGVILALLFGPSQLPKLGRSIGETIREFRAIGKEIER